MNDLVNYLIAKRRQAATPIATAPKAAFVGPPQQAVVPSAIDTVLGGAGAPLGSLPATVGTGSVLGSTIPLGTRAGLPTPGAPWSGSMGPGLKGAPGFVGSRQAASDRFGSGAGMAYDYAAAYSPAYLKWLLANVFTGQNAPWNAVPDAWRAFGQMTAGQPGYGFGPAA